MEADVIRWIEAAWEKRRRLRGRAVNAGERMVVAEVIRDEDGWVEASRSRVQRRQRKRGGY